MFAGRVEARITVPSGGAAVSATNSGGGPTAVTVPAGSYWHSTAGGVTGLLTTIQNALNLTRAPADGAWSVTMSTGATGDCRITIDCTSGGKLTKTGGTDGVNDAGANITTSLAGDGFVEMTAAASAGSTRVVVGLAPSNTSAGRDSGYYFELVEGGQLWVRELGVDIGQVSTWADGDVFRVRRTGTTLTYEKNGTTVYTSLASVSVALYGDFSLKNAGTKAVGVRLYDGSSAAYQAVTWSNVTNVTTAATTYSLAWTSTMLRDNAGFTADISAANTPSTGTKQARGVWRPNITLQILDTKLAPLVTDLRTTQSPTGAVLGLVGNTFYRVKQIAWPYVPAAQYREALVTYANSSWEQFYKDTQIAQGGTTWFSVSSPVQIYDHNGWLVGGDLNSGAGPANGWQMTGVVSTEATQPVQGYAGFWRIEIPQLVTSG